MKNIASFFALALLSLACRAATTVPVQLLNPTGSTSGQAIVSTGSSSAPGWGSIGVSGLSAISANSLIGNATGASATPTAVAVTGCNGAAQALQWTSGTGFGCNSNIATAGANANITSLTGLTTPLGTWAGGLGANNTSANGVPVFVSGTATVTAATGTGIPVLGTSPTITTPTINGVTNGSAAPSGAIGEYQNATTTGTSLTSNTAANAASKSLTAGDWDVECTVQYNPAGTTVPVAFRQGISTTSATFGSEGSYSFIQATFATGAAQAFTSPIVELNLTSTTTVYCVSLSTFSTSTMTVDGVIRARRMH